MDKVFLTREGLEKLKAKYDEYVNKKRPDASDKIRIAREYGDLSENAEYDAAKEEQAMIEAEIKKMEAQLNNFEVIDDVIANSKSVRIGSKVIISGLTSEDAEYEIVGSTEANINATPKRISNESPLAKALIGKKEKATVKFDTPKGEKEVTITKINNG